jgi:hypothetical protein
MKKKKQQMLLSTSHAYHAFTAWGSGLLKKQRPIALFSSSAVKPAIRD